MSNSVTVCIPSIPPRRDKLKRAVQSVMMQDMPVNLSVYVDRGKRGAAFARDMALAGANTEWVAFLDDDDEFDPDHVVSLLECARAYDAHYVWSRYRIAHPMYSAPGKVAGYVHPFADGNTHPLGAGTFEQWNDAQPAQTTVTTLVRRELAMAVGGFQDKPSGVFTTFGQNMLRGEQERQQIDGQPAREDWSFTLRCRAAGATFRHHPEVTWTWHHHESNTSGLPDRW